MDQNAQGSIAHLIYSAVCCGSLRPVV